MSVHDYLGKLNVLANALCRFSMGSVAHIKEEKKELVKDANCLCRLEEYISQWCNS